ncbi:MAG: hypothetical protein FJX25_05225 [Alphaproteobacteria bacterium]|nr:hypothetical protein [Alphaproteobacteria bacterium]
MCVSSFTSRRSGNAPVEAPARTVVRRRPWNK